MVNRAGPLAGLVLLALSLPPACPASAPHPDGPAVRERLDDIFSRPRLRRAKTDPPDVLGRLLRGFLEWLGSLRDRSPFAYWLLLVLGGALVGLLVFFVARRVRRVFTVGEGRGSPPADEQRRRQLSRAWRDEAGRRAERGEFTEAVRCLFLSLVHRLDETGQVLFRQSHTNREYLRLFDDRPALASSLREFVDVLDDHWYGQRPTDEPLYRHCLGLYQDLERRAA
jgi:hypothetical protein